MAEIRIPHEPIDHEPLHAIRDDEGKFADATIRRQALTQALDGLELGAYDETIAKWLTTWEPSTVAVVCSWIVRARQQGEARA
jgi:hypothetical protein